jgi:hypothetical protein
MRRVDPVADSLIAAGRDSALVRQVARLLKGEQVPGGPAATVGGGGGGGGGGAVSSQGQQRGFVERPGEGNVGGGGGGGGGNPLTQIVQAFAAAGVRPVPGVQLPGGFGAFGGGGGGTAALVEPGTYTATASIDGRTLSAPVVVIRRDP